MAILKIDGARFIVTVDPERCIIRDGSILIEGQRIVRLAEHRDIRARSQIRCGKAAPHSGPSPMAASTLPHKVRSNERST